MDAATIVEMRIRSTRERRLSESDVEEFRTRCVARFEEGIRSGELRVWLAFDGERAIGTAMLMLLPNIPRLGVVAGPDARVRNVYVDPACRGRGVAQLMMSELLAEAKRAGVDRLTLGTSEMGRPVYEKLGFKQKSDEMIVDLRSL